MSHRQSVSIISALLSPENDARPTFLLGAGASFSSGIPLAAESVRRLARQTYAEIEQGRRVLPEQIKTSEWVSWLHSKPWFIHGDEKLGENFPLIIEHLLKPEAYRRRALLELTALKGEIGEGYRSLAELVLRGLVSTVLTTNFDICLPKALNDKRPHIRHVAEVNRGPDDFNEFSLYARAQIIWLHGKAEQYTDRNLVEETRTLDPKLLKNVAPLLNATPLVIVGYRGAEPSIMDSLLGPSSGIDFRQGVYWCARKGETLYPSVEILKSRLGKNFQLLEIDGFDELLVDVNKELSGVQRFLVQPSVAAAQFDDRPLQGASWADIDTDLSLATLKKYCEKLERGAITSQELRPLMHELGLLVTKDGVECPSVGCVLLFGRDPNRFFPHAIISATVDGKKRKVFSGNLLRQRQAVLEWLDEEGINPTIKVKKGRNHESSKAYSDRAIVELLVNMLVHRDYEVGKASFIEVSANRSIRFSNPGARSPTANVRLECDADGVFSPVPEFSDLRNRALCDVFFGMSAMERSGTGLVDAVDLSRQQGGAATFAFPPEQDLFVGELFRPEASAGSSHIAKDTRPVGTYLINVLPFVSMPQTVTHLKINGGWRELEEKVALENAGSFVLEKTGDLWSFATAKYLQRLFAPVLAAPAEEIALSDIELDEVLRKKVSWLVRRHFEQHLRRFENDGLVIEESDGRPAKRAYFQSARGRDRIFVYDTASRKGIRRGVAKRRGDEARPYFECEGFGYEVVRLGQTWGVRIKPFYMFTKQDGVTPLPGYLRTRRSTRRIRLDRNANVESDLVFWGRFLSKGEQTVNIGDERVPDLLLDGSFFTVDVQEGGLVSSELIAKDKRSA